VGTIWQELMVAVVVEDRTLGAVYLDARPHGRDEGRHTFTIRYDPARPGVSVVADVSKKPH
jgi:hypothetical protein